MEFRPRPNGEMSIPDPYPGAFRSVDCFRYTHRLVLAREPDALLDAARRKVSYYVAEDYPVRFRVDGEERELVVPEGMLTDLASVPWFARSLVGRVGPHLEAAIVHDFLYIAWQLIEGREPRREDWRFANEVMFAALWSARVGILREAAIRAALRLPVVSWSLFREREAFHFVELPPEARRRSRSAPPPA
jgi:hypothetical protein